jgi:hypothetical protein
MNDVQFSKQGRRKGFDRYGQMCWKVKSSETLEFFSRFINIIKLTCFVDYAFGQFHYLSPTSPMFSTMGYLFFYDKRWVVS